MSATDPFHRIRLVLKHWVADQHRYFSRAGERENERAERGEHWVTLTLWCAVIVASLLALGLVGCPFLKDIKERYAWLDLSIILIDLLLAAGALIHHLRERKAYTEHAKQYSRMGKIFSYASAQIANALEAQDYTAARETLRKLGREALAENGDWVLLHRERPLELPHP
jgi:hypothetical protein